MYVINLNYICHFTAMYKTHFSFNIDNLKNVLCTVFCKILEITFLLNFLMR